MKVRLDKYLSNLGFGSRKEVTKFIKQGFVKVNGEVVKKSDVKLQEADEICFLDEKIPVKENITILIHKPSWYVSSDVDEWGYLSYKSLIWDCPYKNLLKVAGRLDVDTEGLIVASSDGWLIHSLISPKQEKEKIYYVELESELSDEDIKKLEEWVDIWDYVTKPSRVLKLPSYLNEIISFWDFKEKTLSQIPKKPLKGKQAILLAITEWKFHQIKRMIQAVWNKVVYLKRLKMWSYELEDLEKWDWKYVQIWSPDFKI